MGGTKQLSHTWGHPNETSPLGQALGRGWGEGWVKGVGGFPEEVALFLCQSDKENRFLCGRMARCVLPGTGPGPTECREILG